MASRLSGTRDDYLDCSPTCSSTATTKLPEAGKKIKSVHIEGRVIVQKTGASHGLAERSTAPTYPTEVKEASDAGEVATKKPKKLYSGQRPVVVSLGARRRPPTQQK